MRDTSRPAERPLRAGSLFSGYGGLDLAVERVFNAETRPPTLPRLRPRPPQYCGLCRLGLPTRQRDLAASHSTARDDLATHQLVDLAFSGPPDPPTRRRESENLWTLIEDIFNDGDATPAPSPDGNTSPDDPHQHQHS